MLKIDLIDAVLWNKASVITTDSEELDISNIYKTKKSTTKKNQQKKPTKQKNPPKYHHTHTCNGSKSRSRWHLLKNSEDVCKLSMNYWK